MDTVWTGVLIGVGIMVCGATASYVLRRRRGLESQPILEPRVIRQWKMRNLVVQQ